MSGFFSATHRFVTENLEDPAKGHWYSPRRYDAHLEKLPEVTSLRSLTKAAQLNYTIKRLLILTLRTRIRPNSYHVENGILYAVTGDAISDDILQINTTQSSVLGTKLQLP